MCSSLGSSDSVAGHLVTLKFYKNKIYINNYKILYAVICPRCIIYVFRFYVWHDVADYNFHHFQYVCYDLPWQVQVNYMYYAAALYHFSHYVAALRC